MTVKFSRVSKPLGLGVAIALFAFIAPYVLAQNEGLQEKLAAIKEIQTVNKKKIAQYKWRQTMTIRVKGSVKGTTISKVRVGPDGEQEKTVINADSAPLPSGGIGIRQYLASKKKGEVEYYVLSVGELAEQYTQIDPNLLIQAKEQGNLFMQPAGPGAFNLVAKSLIKQGDSVTFAVDDKAKQIMAVNITSYLDDPSETFSITARFAKLPDGTNHVDTAAMNTPSMKLIVNTQNSNYEKVTQGAQ
jgi:hypothetical protein